MKNVVNRALVAKKKVLFIAFTALVFCACRGPVGPVGPQGPQGPAGEGVNWKIVDVIVEANMWKYSGYTDNNYFYATCNMPELTSYVFTDGNVQGYIYLLDNNETIQHSLPYVLHKEVFDNAGNQYLYTTTVDFVYGVGWVQFEMRDTDFAYETDASINPEQMKFRIVITY